MIKQIDDLHRLVAKKSFPFVRRIWFMGRSEAQYGLWDDQKDMVSQFVIFNTDIHTKIIFVHD